MVKIKIWFLFLNANHTLISELEPNFDGAAAGEAPGAQIQSSRIYGFYTPFLFLVLPFRPSFIRFQSLSLKRSRFSSLYCFQFQIGGEHLLRLFVRLPHLISASSIESDQIASSQKSINHFLKYRFHFCCNFSFLLKKGSWTRMFRNISKRRTSPPLLNIWHE